MNELCVYEIDGRVELFLRKSEGTTQYHDLQQSVILAGSSWQNYEIQSGWICSGFRYHFSWIITVYDRTSYNWQSDCSIGTSQMMYSANTSAMNVCHKLDIVRNSVDCERFLACHIVEDNTCSGVVCSCPTLRVDVLKGYYPTGRQNHCA